jgi:hypothetical protein
MSKMDGYIDNVGVVRFILYPLLMYWKQWLKMLQILFLFFYLNKVTF